MSVQSVLEKIHPAGKFFLLIGLFLLGLGLASVVQILILASFADMKSLADFAELSDYSNPRIIAGMKIAQAISAVLAFIVPALLFAYFSSEKKISYLKMNSGVPFVSGITVMLLIFAMMPVINFTGEINGKLTLPEFLSEMEKWMKANEENLKQLTEAFLKMESVGDLLLNLFVIALLAALGEELLFRGAMQNVLLQWTRNTHLAVWLTAILFSALHAQFYGFLPRMILGVVLGYLYAWSGSLWLPVLFHFLNNGMAVVFSFFIGKGVLPEETETIGAGETSFYLVLSSALISTGLLLFIYKKRPVETD